MNARKPTPPIAEKLRIVHRLVLGGNLLLFSILYLAIPAIQPGLVEEDYFLEPLSVVVFALACVAGIVGLARARGAPWWYLVIPVGAVLGLVDEIGWGQQLLGFPLARIVLPLVVLGASAWLVYSGSFRKANRRAVELHPPTAFLVPALVLLLVTLVLEFGLVERWWLVFIEELLDLNVAIALVFAGVSIATIGYVPARRVPKAPTDLVPAIVSSAGSPAAVTITQTLGPLGIPIHALSNMDQPACRFSRYTTTCHITEHGRGGSSRHDSVHEPETLLDYLIQNVERGVLFPGTDANVRFLAHHKQTLLDAGFRMCIPDEDVLTKAANKSDLAEFCTRHSFPIPQTVIVDSREDLSLLSERLRYPIVLKGVFMKNHCFVPGPGELSRVYDRFELQFQGKTDNPRAVAQEWIPGPAERFVKLYVVFDQQSRPIAWHTLRRLRVHTRKDGSQGDTLVAITERVQACVDRWIPFFEALRWVGVASMECKYDERDGEYKLIEINPRPWAILKISVDCGVNVPLLYYKLALGEPVPRQQPFEEGRYYIRLLWGNIDEPEPWRVLGMLVTRRIGLGEVLRLYWKLIRNLRHVTVDVGRLRDPWPTLACMYYYGVRYFKHWF